MVVHSAQPRAPEGEWGRGLLGQVCGSWWVTSKAASLVLKTNNNNYKLSALHHTLPFHDLGKIFWKRKGTLE